MEDEFELIDEEDFADAPLDVSGDVPAPSRSLFSCTLAAITPTRPKVVIATTPPTPAVAAAADSKASPISTQSEDTASPAAMPDEEDIDDAIDDDTLTLAYLQHISEIPPLDKLLQTTTGRDKGERDAARRIGSTSSPIALLPLFLFLVVLGVVRLGTESAALAGHEVSRTSGSLRHHQRGQFKARSTMASSTASNFRFESALDLAARGAERSPTAVAAASRAIAASAHLRAEDDLDLLGSPSLAFNSSPRRAPPALAPSARPPRPPQPSLTINGDLFLEGNGDHLRLLSGHVQINGNVCLGRGCAFSGGGQKLALTSTAFGAGGADAPDETNETTAPTHEAKAAAHLSPHAEKTRLASSVIHPAVTVPPVLIPTPGGLAHASATPSTYGAVPATIHSSTYSTSSPPLAASSASPELAVKTLQPSKAVTTPAMTKVPSPEAPSAAAHHSLDHAAALTELLQATLGRHGTTLERHAHKAEVTRLLDIAHSRAQKHKALVILSRPDERAAERAAAAAVATTSAAAVAATSTTTSATSMPAATMATLPITTHSVGAVEIRKGGPPCRGIACVLPPHALTLRSSPQHLAAKYVVPRSARPTTTEKLAAAVRLAAAVAKVGKVMGATGALHDKDNNATASGASAGCAHAKTWSAPASPRPVASVSSYKNLTVLAAVLAAAGEAASLTTSLSTVSLSTPPEWAPPRTVMALVPTPAPKLAPALAAAGLRKMTAADELKAELKAEIGCLRAKRMANRSRNLPPMLPPPTLIPPVLVPPLPPIERSPRCRWRQLLALLAASSLAHPIPRFGTQLALWNASLAWGRKDAADSADCSHSSSIVPYGYRYMYGWAMPTGGFNGRPSRRNATMIKKITCGGRLCLPAAPVRARLSAPAGDALTLWPRSAAQRALLVARAASYYRSAANAPNAAAATHHHGKSIGRLAADWTTLLSWLAIGGIGGGLADVGDSSNATTLSVAAAATAGSNGMASADAVARQIVPYRRHRAKPNATSRREPLLASHPSRAPSCEHFLAALPPPPARPCLPPPPLKCHRLSECRKLARAAAQEAVRRVAASADAAIAHAHARAARSASARAAAAHDLRAARREASALKTQMARLRTSLHRKETHLYQVESVLGRAGELAAETRDELREEVRKRRRLEIEIGELRAELNEKVTGAVHAADERVARAQRKAESRRQQAARLAKMQEASARREAKMSRKVLQLSEKATRLAEEVDALRAAAAATHKRGTNGDRPPHYRKAGGGGGARRGGEKEGGKSKRPPRHDEREFWRRELAKARAQEQARRARMVSVATW